MVGEDYHMVAGVALPTKSFPPPATNWSVPCCISSANRLPAAAVLLARPKGEEGLLKI